MASLDERLRSLGEARRDDRAYLVDATARVAGQMWDEVDPRRIVDSWAAQVPELTGIVTGAQVAAVRPADTYVAETLAVQGLDDGAVSSVDPAGFAGQASDGRDLMSLLTNPAFVALSSIADGVDVIQALGHGRASLDLAVRTQVADAGRLADQVSLVGHPAAGGYVRVTVGPTCSRCMVLAGRFYQWNDGFQRHPLCDCVHLPSGVAASRRLIRDPRDVYELMTPAQRSRAGFSLADQKAIDAGADINQVVNAKRAIPDGAGGWQSSVFTAGGKRYTREGTTRRGFYGGYRVDENGRLVRRRRGEPAPPLRKTVDQILQDARSRADALEQLRRYRYITSEAPLPERVLLGARSSRTGAGAGRSAARGPQDIRQALADAPTPDAVSRVLADEYRRLTGRDVTVKLEGSVETAREHAEGILRVVERYPTIELREVTTENLLLEHAGYIDQRIIFDRRITSLARRDQYLGELAEDKARGWHPHGTPVGNAIHEMGHALDVDTLGEAIRPELRAVLERHGGASEAARKISGYATEDEAELIAEAFADVLTNGERASVVSRDVVALLDEAYAKRVGRAAVRRPGELLPTKAAPRKAVKAGLPTELSYDERLARLQEIRQSPIQDIVDPEQGLMGRVEIQVRGGQRVVQKVNAGPDAVRDTDAEELASRLFDAIGAPAPAVLRLDRTVIVQEFADGTIGREFAGDAARLRALAESEDGRLIGLGDVLTANTDRSLNNVVIARDGRVIAIDQGTAFPSGFDLNAGSASEFSESLLDGPNAFTRQELAAIRARVDALRPEFERLGHLDWFEDVKRRLADVESRAAGVAKAAPRKAAKAAAAPTERELRQAARDRSKVLQVQADTGEMLAEVDRLLAIKADRAVIREALGDSSRAVWPNADPAALAALRSALDSGDLAKVRAAVTAQTRKAKVGAIGRSGQRVEFDPDTMQPFGGVIEPGTRVQVVSRGVRSDDGAVLVRARVTPVTPAKKAAAKAPAKKAAAPKAPPAPAKMAAPALRKELAAAGVPEPLMVGVPKPALAKALEGARAGSTPQITRARVVQAVKDARGEVIDTLREASKALADGASERALQALAKARLAKVEQSLAGWPELTAVRGVLTAMQAGDKAAIQRAVKAATKRAKLDVVGGEAGAVARFDRATMAPIGSAIPDGAAVQVVRPGFAFTVDGERIALRADVEPAAAVAEEVARPAAIGPKASKLRKVADPEDMQAQAMGTNPRYLRAYEGPLTREMEEAGGVGYAQNCSRCVIAYEMRRRGLDVTAGAGLTTGDVGAVYLRTFRQDGKYATRIVKDLSREMSARDVAREVESWPRGARGIVTVQGHTLNVERDIATGKVRFIDTQAARDKSPVMDYAAFVRRMKARGAPTDRLVHVARVDDLDLSDYGLRYVESPGLRLTDGRVGRTEYPEDPNSPYSLTWEETEQLTPDDTYP